MIKLVLRDYRSSERGELVEKGQELRSNEKHTTMISDNTTARVN